MKLTDIVAVEPVSKIKEVGIEIEVEGENLPIPPTGWRRTGDGSLRGESCEYIFKTPVARSTAMSYLNRMNNAYEEEGTVVHESTRQSVHVHINVQHMEMIHIFNYISLFLAFEKSLVMWCGEYRQGNLFCLRSSDAEALLTALEGASYDRQNFHSLNTPELRYAALNVTAMFKYGSLEFRSMRGTADMSLIKKWMQVLLRLKDYSETVQDPAVLVSEFSGANPREFVEDVFGSYADIIFADENWLDHMYEGLRNIQQICYLGDWDSYREDVPQMESTARLVMEGRRNRPQIRWTPEQEDRDELTEEELEEELEEEWDATEEEEEEVYEPPSVSRTLGEVLEQRRRLGADTEQLTEEQHLAVSRIRELMNEFREDDNE